MAQYDLLGRMSKYMDAHLLFPLLEFTQTCGIYKEDDLLRAKIELLKRTNMVDYAIDIYNAVNKTDQGSDELRARREEVVARMRQLQVEAEPITAFISDPAKVDTLRGEKTHNSTFMQVRGRPLRCSVQRLSDRRDRAAILIAHANELAARGLLQYRLKFRAGRLLRVRVAPSHNRRALGYSLPPSRIACLGISEGMVLSRLACSGLAGAAQPSRVPGWVRGWGMHSPAEHRGFWIVRLSTGKDRLVVLVQSSAVLASERHSWASSVEWSRGQAQLAHWCAAQQRGLQNSCQRDQHTSSGRAWVGCGITRTQQRQCLSMHSVMHADLLACIHICWHASTSAGMHTDLSGGHSAAHSCSGITAAVLTGLCVQECAHGPACLTGFCVPECAHGPACGGAVEGNASAGVHANQTDSNDAAL